MVFGIDFDGTFSRDPELWKSFIDLASARGHSCVLVTGRSGDGEYGQQVLRSVDGSMPVVFAGPEWKREAAAKKGWLVDVWIDDNPEWVSDFMLKSIVKTK